jgi:dTDP-4-amino-4,6-dideoxy-D-glucose/dTDP-4-amino-2,4-dideoxy-beta-L-xylose transaminase
MRQIPLFKVAMDEGVCEPVARTLMSGYVGEGPKVKEFETLLGGYLGNNLCLATNSCTSAIQLGLRLMKETRGDPGRDEILTTPLTCLATNMPILAEGLRPRWVDVDPKTLNVNIDDLKAKTSKKTLGIVVVHWGGVPVDLDAVASVQQHCVDAHGLNPFVLEDCAHALGAEYKSRRLGTHANLCAFSFQAIKHLTTGDGGLLACPSWQTYDTARKLRWFGLDRNASSYYRCEQTVELWGYKAAMNDIAATVGLNNFPLFQTNLARHRDNADWLRKELPKLGVVAQSDGWWARSADWVFTVLVPRRDDFIAAMNDRGVAASRVHDRNDRQPCFAEFAASLPGTDAACEQMACLPCGWWVSAEDRAYIAECVGKGW